MRSATELYRLDLAGRRAGGGGIWQSLAGSFAVSAYATPASRWLITPADSSVARDVNPSEGSGAPLKVGHSDVQKLREAAEDARRWDSKYGGGDWRSSMVPECLRVEAAPLLLGAYSDEVGRALFGASAELTRLAGWMAFDTGQQEAAQRYYIQALRLARAAADVLWAAMYWPRCPPGDLPRLRRRGRRPRPGSPRAQPGARHRPHHELLPSRRGTRPRARG